jgi:hypothetical protein
VTVPKSEWKWNSLARAWVHEDKYAIRYVYPLLYRVVAYKFFKTLCRFSDTVAFYHEYYASLDDTIQAAKNWCLRGELEWGDAEPYELALGVYRTPDPIVESLAW